MTDRAPEPDDTDLDLAIDTIVAEASGDKRAAIRMLLIAHAHLQLDVARISRLGSSGFTRGVWRQTDEKPDDQTAGLPTAARKGPG